MHVDLSGWSPKYFPPILVQYANTLLKDKVLFGTDFPMLTPERWRDDLERTAIRDEIKPGLYKHNAAPARPVRPRALESCDPGTPDAMPARQSGWRECAALPRPEGGWAMAFGTTVTAVLVSVAMVGAPATAAYAGQPATVPRGNDVSYPQCSETLPSGQAFGIVAVNEGLANNTNPCLTAELSWARASTGGARQPRVSLYVNTADPGNHGVADWPTDNNDPLTGSQVTDPYGACTGRNNQACAWQYGWDMADLDAQARGVPDPGRYRWWLDVETLNSWQSSSRNNRADLEGMVSYFHRVGATAGIYSTARQWDPIVGPVPSNSPLYRLPDWIPGAKTLAQAKKNCRLARLTGGGIVSVTQWRSKPANSDFSCRSLPNRGRDGRNRPRHGNPDGLGGGEHLAA